MSIISNCTSATSFCEIFQLEMLGFAEDGKGGKLVEDGATKLGGRLPVNLSGGIGVQGASSGCNRPVNMIHELALQLRGEAGDRQTGRARIALAENGGGVIGFDEAACSVILLEAPFT
jgi:Acetyl-CoA acetyltransferase